METSNRYLQNVSIYVQRRYNINNKQFRLFKIREIFRKIQKSKLYENKVRYFINIESTVI